MRSIILLVGLMIFGACQKNDDANNNTPTKDYEVGKNRFTLISNGDEREYWVHVPASYNKVEAIPVVFMLHGRTGNGEKFYNISGWKELGETENILTVFPSSWEYCIELPNGSTRTLTKWNVLAEEAPYCTGHIPRDDNQFFRDIIEQLNQKFNIDKKRNYLVGFSNGGVMAFSCSIELSDLVAAIVESAGSTLTEETYIPNKKIPITYQIGNADHDSSNPLPLKAFDSLLNTQPFKKTIQTHINSFDLEGNYTTSGDPNEAMTATYKGISDPSLEFNVTIIKDLQHSYPNGTNHPMKAAEVNWEWLKQFTLTD